MGTDTTGYSARERRTALLDLGVAITPDMIAGSVALSAPLVDDSLGDGVAIAADLAYGTHERNVLDVYFREGSAAGARPVLLFVHGGGFTAGAKSNPATPFFRNLGTWAVQQGWVAVAMNYRLAPEHLFPAGAEDIASAITWIVEHIGPYGGDPERIVLSGQSAGAVHVADYLVGRGGFGPQGRALRGAALLSGLYDSAAAAAKGMFRVYWGDDERGLVGRPTLDELLELDLPLLFTVSEFDDREFQAHAALLVSAWHARHGEFPPLHRLYGQNHLTSVYAIGTAWDEFGPLLRRFVEATT